MSSSKILKNIFLEVQLKPVVSHSKKTGYVHLWDARGGEQRPLDGFQLTVRIPSSYLNTLSSSKFFFLCYDWRMPTEENTRTSDVKRGVFPLCRVADSRMADGQASRSSSRQDRQYMAQQQGNTSMTSNHKTSTNTIRALALHSTTRQHLIPTRPVTC